MNDADLRAIVRDAVRRHLGPGGADPEHRSSSPSIAASAPGGSGHVSHGVYVTLVNSTDQCVIEPSVRCEHCGYCKSHGY